MKSLKSKVIASLAMLIVAAVMMTSSSFAWYTISKQGEVEAIDVEMSATENLEIARATTETKEPEEAALGDATTGDTTWGSRVWDWEDPEELTVPASVASGAVLTADYDADNRLKTDLISCGEGTIADGMTTYTATLKEGTDDEEEAVAAIEYAVWLRANQDLDDVVYALSNEGDASIAVIVDGEQVEEGDKFELSKNEATLVKIIGYFDGTDLHAEDVIGGKSATGIEVLFTSASVD